MNKSLHLLVIGVALCISSLAATADIYKWKNGKVVTYSQLPPGKGVPSERIRSNTHVAAADDPSAKTAAPGSDATKQSAGDVTRSDGAAKEELTPEQEKLKAQLAKDGDSRLAELARRRAEQCTKAHGQFDELTQHARLRVQDAKGKWKILNDADRKAKLQEIQGRIVEFCATT